MDCSLCVRLTPALDDIDADILVDAFDEAWGLAQERRRAAVKRLGVTIEVAGLRPRATRRLTEARHA